MVVLLIVSHSRHVAIGLREMAVGMVPTVDLPVLAIGGIDDEEHPLGSDALTILAALEEVNSPDGVAVFTDIGSSRLNAETAIDFIDGEIAIRIVDAPMVEGLLAAAVAAAGGADLDGVVSAAREALAPSAATATTAVASTVPPPDALTAECRLRNRLGLHLRSAALLIGALTDLDAAVWLRNVTTGTGFVNGRSINRVVTLGAVGGSRVMVAAQGRDAELVLGRFTELVDEGLGDGIDPAFDGQPYGAPVRGEYRHPERGAELHGFAIRSGVAVGPSLLPASAASTMAGSLAASTPIGDVDAEMRRFERALTEVRSGVQALQRQTRIGADIFSAHLLFIDDPELIGQVRRGIRDDRRPAEEAWQMAIGVLLASYRQIADPSLRARGDDLRDVGGRLLHCLADETGGGEGSRYSHEPPSVLCLERLLPSDVVELQRAAGQPSAPLAVCVASGEPASHAGILAGGLSIPVIFNLGAALLKVASGQRLFVDGYQGRVVVDPDPELIASAQRRTATDAARHAIINGYRQRPTRTAGGAARTVGANAAGLGDVAAAQTMGADEVGLFRTEFLYIGRSAPPDEEEQLSIYRRALELMGGRPVTIRTMDVGGDKQVAYLRQGMEANPNLGLRGIRLSLARPDLFRIELRALLRAGVAGQLRVMLPMVVSVDEVVATRRLIDQLIHDLHAEGQPVDQTPRLGVMIETPAAVWYAERLAHRVDFFSIGTNDLTQYAMAADRNNVAVAELADPLQPAVLEAISRTVAAAHTARIPIGICGQVAADPLATPVLLGLGIDELSVPPALVAETRYAIAQWHLDRAREIATEALTCTSAKAVRALCASASSG